MLLWLVAASLSLTQKVMLPAAFAISINGSEKNFVRKPWLRNSLCSKKQLIAAKKIYVAEPILQWMTSIPFMS